MNVLRIFPFITIQICRPCLSDVHLLADSHPLSAFSRRTDMRSGGFLMAARGVVCKDADTIFIHGGSCPMSFGIFIFVCAVSGLFYTYAMYPALLLPTRHRGERIRP